MVRRTAEIAWNAIEEFYSLSQNSSCKGMCLNRGAKDLFIDTFENKYYEIMNCYMDKSVEVLDRHKQAAILIHCTISCDVITPREVVSDDEIFVGAQQVALLLGLSFMKDCLNEILKKHNLKTIKRYTFPVAYSCSTDYFNILTRDLYLQSHKDDAVYILFLSHLLFFIEYLTVRESGLDESVLREWSTNEL